MPMWLGGKGRVLRVLDGILSWLIKACAILACMIIAAMTLLITLEVILRSFFERTMFFTDEYSGYMVLAVMALGIAYCREKNELLTVNFIIDRLAPAIRSRVVFIYGLVSLAFCILLDWQIVRLWLQSIDRNIKAGTVVATPLWIPQLLLLVGVTLLCLVVARKLVRPDPFELALAADVLRE